MSQLGRLIELSTLGHLLQERLTSISRRRQIELDSGAARAELSPAAACCWLREHRAKAPLTLLHLASSGRRRRQLSASRQPFGQLNFFLSFLSFFTLNSSEQIATAQQRATSACPLCLLSSETWIVETRATN